MSDNTNNTKEEFEKKANELARQRKEQHDNDKAAYVAAQQKKRQEKWIEYEEKLRKKGMTRDSRGNAISKEEVLKQDLEHITSKAANTTSNWQEALMEECRLCYDLIKVLNLDIRMTRSRFKMLLSKNLLVEQMNSKRKWQRESL